MKLVLAKNYQRFCCWCMENKTSPRDRNVVFVSDVDRIRGIRDAEIIRYQDYWDREDAKEIEEQIKIMELFR